MKTLPDIRSLIERSEPFRQLWEAPAGSPIHLRGIHGSLLAFVAAAVFERRTAQTVLVVPDDDTAEKLSDDCALLLGESNVRLFEHVSAHKAKLLDMSSSIAQVEALKALAEKRNVLVVASAPGMVTRVPLPGELISRSLDIHAGHQHPFQPLIEQLAGFGFERKEFVEEYGDMAVRGGILDVFPFVGEHPVRIEFWGDTVESIREFDALSQRSIRELRSASIVGRVVSHDEGNPQDSPHTGSLFDYLEPGATLILHEPTLIEKEVDELREEGIAGVFGWSELLPHAGRYPQLIHSNIASSSGAIDFGSQPQPSAGGSVKVLVRQIREENSEGNEVLICCETKEEGKRVRELIEEEGEVRREPNNHDDQNDQEVTHRDDEGIHRLDEPETDSTPPELPYQLLPIPFHSGFVFSQAHTALFTEHEIFGRLKRRSTGRKGRFKGFTHKEVSQLRRGDYVTHVDFGIGRFAGLQRIRVRGVEQEVMKIEYEENDAIYVNLNFVNRVQKYSSHEGHVPKLSRPGTPDWERLKTRARKKIKDIARDLIKLYARRKAEEGFAFAPDTHWQKEMEASFMYEDTPDQAKSTLDVKQDMESPSPMDRLICGDVGFGKTEVAVRAAFKAVMNGKQAAILVPTTILAQQHYHTFLDRMGRYGVRVESISRFKSTKEQKAVIGGLKAGSVDVLIGTHRLLSKDVEFKDLGLLVIDEEHRFGVTAKEKLRNLRATVDTLTLTATPIPRTLQFSLMGARDLSIIQTPPRNRLPIVTEIAQFDIAIIREAVIKELHRGGQVYVIHDRIQTMDTVLAQLQERIPEARFRSAHGQMAGHDLEKTMLDFLEKKFDVLLCTKIIESGIDIPSVNTIVINRADRFGLAELYQLRGRVGRSNVQAYAYLLTPPLLSLPRQSLRRLQAVQEFTELGSGFNLAMRDLEIRGAGNLLGAEQSGFIMDMGYEMYLRVVEDAVRELKEEEFSGMEVLGSGLQVTGSGEGPGATRLNAGAARETVIESDIEALIPALYVESDAERLDIYRRLYRSTTLGEVEVIRKELRDRFGEYPEEVEYLFGLVELKLIAGHAGFIKVDLSGDTLQLHFPPPDAKEFYEGQDGVEAPFQRIMQAVPSIREVKLHLRQSDKVLLLTGTMSNIPSAGMKTQLVREILQRLQLQDGG